MTELKRSSSAYSSCGIVFDYAEKQAELVQIETRMAAVGFWDNQETAQEVVGALKSLKSIMTPLERLIEDASDLEAILEMAREDESVEGEVAREVQRLDEQLEELELKALLNGAHDSAGAILSINARDGGTDANDWAEMMLRMYTLWAQKNDYSLSLLDRNDNEEAGLNSCSIAVRGPMAYGYLKGESGMHRLVRISPFNADGKRQTSFAAVDVTPEISDAMEIEVRDADVEMQTYRAQGAGGQHVNKTDSAVRLIHKPSGVVVQCQNERSQHKNRATALKMLRAKLVQIEEDKREAEEAEKYKNKARVGFGSQIRNYFLHPDQRVKDARTGFTTGKFHEVLDGNLQGFLDAFLRWRIGQGE